MLNNNNKTTLKEDLKKCETKVEFKIFTDLEELVNTGYARPQVEIKWFTGEEHGFDLPDNFKNHAQLKLWCESNCTGPIAFLECMNWNSKDMIYFFYEEDAMAFKLKWL